MKRRREEGGKVIFVVLLDNVLSSVLSRLHYLHRVKNYEREQRDR